MITYSLLRGPASNLCRVRGTIKPQHVGIRVGSYRTFERAIVSTLQKVLKILNSADRLVVSLSAEPFRDGWPVWKLRVRVG